MVAFVIECWGYPFLASAIQYEDRFSFPYDLPARAILKSFTSGC